jgi:hypothetical protein
MSFAGRRDPALVKDYNGIERHDLYIGPVVVHRLSFRAQVNQSRFSVPENR